MKALHLAAVAAAVSVGLCLQADAHMSGMSGVSASASAHAAVVIHGRGFGFRHGLPFNRFRRTHFDFGRGFRSHEIGLFTGGAADFDYADYDEDDYGPGDDIGNLHFRAQEPFGPGDIGRPPVRAETDAPYLSGRMDPWHGYEPED